MTPKAVAGMGLPSYVAFLFVVATVASLLETAIWNGK